MARGRLAGERQRGAGAGGGADASPRRRRLAGRGDLSRPAASGVPFRPRRLGPGTAGLLCLLWLTRSRIPRLAPPPARPAPPRPTTPRLPLADSGYLVEGGFLAQAG